MHLQTDQDDPERIGKKLKELTFKELAVERTRLSAEGIETLPVSLELHRKIAASFAAFVFVTFGLAFGLQLHHHERLTTFVWVLAVFIGYYLATIGMNAVALKGWLPPWAAMWMPNVIGSAVSGLIIARAVRR
jgi:lipopolysaccharide export LptBFGC system permease protein LptF